MSKIRVYELAKELGLENKAVLDLCEQLEIEGKRSHSSTMSDDEADRVRRAVIRQAVTGKEGGTREIEREGGIVTERRMGNVIRRRKKSADEADEAAEDKPRIDLKDVPPATLELPKLAPDLAAEKSARNEAIARANALFKERVQEAAAPVREEVKEAEPVPALEPEEVQEEAAAEAQPETVEPEETEEEIEATKPSPEASEEAQQAYSARLQAARQRLDIRAPKILGKIELPQKAEPAPKRAQEERRESGRRTVVGPEQFEPVVIEGGKAGKKKKAGGAEVDEFEGARKRPKKKQVLRRDDLVDYEGDRDAWRSRKDKKAKGKKDADEAQKPVKRIVKINNEVSVGELAKAMAVKAGEVMTQLMNLGVMSTVNHLIDFETASIIGSVFGVTVQNTGRDEEQFLVSLKAPDSAENLKLRPPVVTVMGHVDHGKTSLLDAIRKTAVTAGEAGGITQHIGAYNVPLPSGGSVTFLDTPGHQAFTAMRSRGAKVTDIVVLVVAADDGVMPQTVEAINHAKAAKVPIIVAINKIDKEGANIDRIKSQIAEHGLTPEDWGGDTIMVQVSAKTKVGIDTLLDNLYAQAEILELKANPDRQAFGTVVESRLDRGRGPVLSILVQNGTLHKGDVFVSGSVFGRVRAMTGSEGNPVDEAGPSIPVEVIGASSPALAGDDFYVLAEESEAREIAETRERTKRLATLNARNRIAAGGPLTLESFAARVAEGETKEFPLIVKGDVQGSVEAVNEALQQLSLDKVRVAIVHSAVGAITENDVQLALASGAIVVGFNVRAEAHAAQMAEDQEVRILYSRIIYELVDEVKAAVLGTLEPVKKEKTLGHVEVRQTFRVPRLGTVAGSYVLDGIVQRGAFVRLLRDNRVIHEGKMASLRRFKDDVREVAAGYECGIGIDGYSDIKTGDIIEVYKIEEVARMQ